MSRKSVVLPKGLVALRPRMSSSDAGTQATVEESVETGTRHALPAIDLKAVQRKAYERGFEHALEQKGAAYDAATSALVQAASVLQDARSKDAAALSEFAVRLACSIAEDLVATTIDEEAHDVRGMARRILDEAMPDLGGGEVTLEGHPDDLALLPNDLRHGTTMVHPHPDPSAPRGTFRVVGGDAEFYSRISDRLDAIRDRMIQEVTDGPA